MNMNWKLKTLSAAVLVVTIAGCAHTKPKEQEANPNAGATPPAQTTGGGTEGATTTGVNPNEDLQSKQMAEEQARQREAAEKAAALLSTRTFYFDYDSNTIQAGDYDSLKAHAAYLAKNPSAKVRVEGNADERGTREYNMALGERRAKAVAAYLTSNGASSGQLTVISYGKEKPAVDGHDEAAWSKNRRVELNYTNGQP